MLSGIRNLLYLGLSVTCLNRAFGHDALDYIFERFVTFRAHPDYNSLSYEEWVSDKINNDPNLYIAFYSSTNIVIQLWTLIVFFITCYDSVRCLRHTNHIIREPHRLLILNQATASFICLIFTSTTDKVLTFGHTVIILTSYTIISISHIIVNHFLLHKHQLLLET